MINKDLIKIECNKCSNSKVMGFSKYKKIKTRLRCRTCGSKNFNSYMLSSQNDTWADPFDLNERLEIMKPDSLKSQKEKEEKSIRDKVKEPIDTIIEINEKIKKPIKVKKRKRTASLLSKKNKSNPKKGDVLDRLWASRGKKVVKKSKIGSSIGKDKWGNSIKVKKSVLKSNKNSQTNFPEHVRKIALGDKVKNRFIKESDGSSRAGWMKDRNSRNS